MTAKHTGPGPAMAPPSDLDASAVAHLGKALPASFFSRDVPTVARELLGQLVVRRVGGDLLVARIVETEAYLGVDDRASHAWDGRRTKRNASLYLSPGHAYVYFIYGMHFCFNVVANRDEGGGAVLFRAAEVVAGRDEVRRRRGLIDRAPRPGELLGGPGRLCRGLAIDRSSDGARLDAGDLTLVEGDGAAAMKIAVGPRIGVDYAGEAAAWPLRFALRGHPEVSRPRLV